MRKKLLPRLKLELLLRKWAATEQFRKNLYYATDFTIYTDNNHLTCFNIGPI